MMARLLVLLFAGLPLWLRAQESDEQLKDKVMAEAWVLYNSERASWMGSDLFVARYPDLQKKAGGYFSYTDGNAHKCLFFDRAENPQVLFSATFDDSFVAEAAQLDTKPRTFTEHETTLYTIREKALALASKDTLFRWYKNTNLNFIPVVSGQEKKVYVLTGPSVNGVVVFGNDYLIEFDKDNNITSKRMLHKNIIPIQYGEETEGATTMHSHKETTGEIITATDVCTLMLYGPYANWDTHIVMSDTKISIWNLETGELLIMAREAWEKIREEGGDKD